MKYAQNAIDELKMNGTIDCETVAKPKFFQ